MMLLIPGKVKFIYENRNMPTATEWHDGQFAPDAYTASDPPGSGFHGRGAAE
jgi:hypothetical protein